MVSVKSLKKAVVLVDELEQIEKMIDNYHDIATSLIESKDNLFLKINLELVSESVETKDDTKEEKMAKKLKERLEEMGMGTAIISKEVSSVNKIKADLNEASSLRIINVMIDDLKERKKAIKEQLKEYNII